MGGWGVDFNLSTIHVVGSVALMAVAAHGVDLLMVRIAFYGEFGLESSELAQGIEGALFSEAPERIDVMWVGVDSKDVFIGYSPANDFLVFCISNMRIKAMEFFEGGVFKAEHGPKASGNV